MSITSTARTAATDGGQDTVVAYDVMREAANRLVAAILTTSTRRGGVVEHATVLAQMGEVRDRAEAVPTRDMVAIRIAAEQFAAETVALRAA